MTRSQPDGYYEEETPTTHLFEVVKLPKWELNDDGTITGSPSAHHDALLYTFIEAAIAHNENIVKEFTERKGRREAAVIDNTTKSDLNNILMGSYNTAGIVRWWKRPRVLLDGKTPAEMWETDPGRVVALVRSFPPAAETE